MADNKFNILKYVYGRLYAGTYANNNILEERSKIFGWVKSLKWLRDNGYIYSYRVIYVDKKYSRITFIFNHSNLIYKSYLNGIDKNLKYHQLQLVPTSEFIDKKEIDEFEQERLMQYKDNVEYITKEDKVQRKVG